MPNQRKSAHVAIPSDALRAVLNLCDILPPLRQLLDDVIQIVIVLDASAVQGELRWRLGSRTKPIARTGLHEAIDSGAVLAVAPTFLKQEIEKYLSVIASETGVSLEVARGEWEQVQRMIRFYTPNGDDTEFVSVDPKDSSYAMTAKELDADFVRTTDAHFAKMGISIIGPELDVVLRDYARSTSILVTMKVGSGFALTVGVQALVEIVRVIVDIIRGLPPVVKLILGICVTAIVMHPTSREKLAQSLKEIWSVSEKTSRYSGRLVSVQCHA